MSSEPDILPISPPSYDLEPELPAYSRNQPVTSHHQPAQASGQKQFSASLTRNGKPVAELVLTANQNLSKSIPTYLEGTAISGRVVLNFSKPQTVQEVVLVIKGSLVTIENPVSPQVFMNIPTKVWVPSLGSSNPSSDSSSPRSEKLEGKIEWPFSINLPREIVAPSGPRNEIGVFRLPETFMERHARVSICYEACLKVRRGRFESDYRVARSFGLIPLIRPDPPSLLRQLAYQDGTQVPSPDIDPHGWHTANSVIVKGNVTDRPVEIRCTLSLPKPLSYTRGSAVPLSLLLKSNDAQTLDLLSSKSIVCRLRRVTKYQAYQAKANDLVAWKDTIEDSQSALWWPCLEIGAETSRRRRISGELHIRKDAKPTSAIAHFRIEYSFALFSFDALGFTATPHTSEPLVSIPVEIATAYPTGPPPRMYIPPGYYETADTDRVNQLQSVYARTMV